MRFKFVAVALGATSVVAQSATSQAADPVKGSFDNVNTKTGQRPSRLPIGNLWDNRGPGWDLYIQALIDFQSAAEDDEKGYFQILGIHGLPFVEWNGAGQVNGGATSGYCTHNEVYFGTWHRAFIALYEQNLVYRAKQIANKYTGSSKATYVAAAKNLRAPYWDWAANPSLPAAVTATQVTVNTPTGKKKVNNPLYQYKFQKWPFKYQYFGGTLANYDRTVRCPSSTSNSAVSQANVVNSALSRDASYLKNSVYLTFTRTSQYSIMVTDSQGGDNFESPHNQIHSDVGCGNPTGHMTNLGWSQFDPIFMLHHANIDRLFAMWQAIHRTNAMFTGTFTMNSGTFGTAKGTSYNANSPMKPFKRTDGSYWTSNQAKSTRAFGYTYPELPDWTMSESDLGKSVKSKVNQLYGTSATTAKRDINEELQDRSATVTQYMALISLDRSEIELPASISISYNNVLAGSMNLLAMPNMPDSDGTRYATIPLQSTLVEAIQGVQHAPLDSILSLLRGGGLQMEIKSQGRTVSASEIPSLTVDLEVLQVLPPATEYDFPTYINSTKLPFLLSDLGISL